LTVNANSAKICINPGITPKSWNLISADEGVLIIEEQKNRLNKIFATAIGRMGIEKGIGGSLAIC
jgi:hypothetical protein